MPVRRPTVLLLGLLASCRSAAAPGAPSPGAAGLPLGRTFNATGASEDGHDRPLAAKAGIRFAADGTTAVATGCNEASAKAQLRQGRLTSDGYVITAKGCVERSVTDQERFVLALLTAQPTMILERPAPPAQRHRGDPVPRSEGGRPGPSP